MAEVTETAPVATVEDAAAVKENGDAAPAENGDAAPAENGTNGHADDEAPKADEKEEAPAAEPPVKKAKKAMREGRRSSSRLQNVSSGTVLSKEISSDNLPKGS